MNKETSEMETGFLPSPVGGLGNQIFNIVSAWVAAKVHGCPLYLPIQDTSRNHHSQEDYTRTVLRFFGVPLSMTQADAIATLGYSAWGNPGFAHWSPSLLSPGTVLGSYFQYYPPLAPFESEIRKLLFKGLPETERKPHAAFLHIRRGDYLGISHIHYVQTMQYYTKALQLLSETASFEHLYILSDDIQWAKQQTWLVADYVKTIFVETNEVDSLAIMASCQAGAICANSTFSWWGAFLGAYGARNPVIVPKRWINEHVENLFPPEWIILDEMQ